MSQQRHPWQGKSSAAEIFYLHRLKTTNFDSISANGYRLLGNGHGFFPAVGGAGTFH
jgi:hypothetical protein